VGASGSLELLARRCHEAAESRIRACEDYHYRADSGVPDAELGEPPSSAPYCGCTTCVIRETLEAVWPILTDPSAGVPDAAAARV
jgi:hypothetical protein